MKEIIDSNFKLTSGGIHLTRNRFTFFLIPYAEVDSASLNIGKSVKNWVIVFSLGIVALLLALLIMAILTGTFSIDEKPIRYFNLFGHGLIVVLVLGVIGSISLYGSLKSVPIIKINTKEKTYTLRIIKNQESLKDIIDFLEVFGVKVNK
ncbi:hypothetical protein [Mariniradius sediminis]|uniref:Uncharacterized protein n=1 Tax=Mariniradius sediminis TaxID=2909237 RepID=A0ABS9BN93_9BACT|nr:hypothetical protein [Mariniradius sediminis]MCF1749531.1 hypothetical protein [Mariniradius sediminis]